MFAPIPATKLTSRQRSTLESWVRSPTMQARAVERVPDETVNLIASVWSHPERRRRRGERFPRRAAFDAVMAVLFFGILLGAFVIAASLH